MRDYRHGYTRGDVDELEKQIKQLLPDAEIDRWCDYGFTLWVRLEDKVVCACQPERRGLPESFVFQQRIWRTPTEVANLLRETERA